MDAEKEKIIGKVRKLMALAGNNPSKDEAEEAMRKAQEILGKYHLSMSSIGTEKAEEATEAVLEDGSKKVPNWKGVLASIVARNFRSEVLKIRTHRARYYQLIMIGEEVDLVSAKEVYQMMLAYFDNSWKAYKKHQRRLYGLKLGSSDRNDYYFGFRKGLKEAFDRNVQSDKGTALMVVKPKSVIDYVAGLGTMFSSRSRVKTNRNHHARSQGYGDGTRFNHKGQIQ